MPREPAAHDFRTATTRYEHWLGRRIALIPSDLARKHDAMRGDLFSFLRATYYRWADRWTEICPEESHAPRILAVGDLHVANFGTWRDAEGRLIWGVNDLDEAWTLPFTNDLVRLATSARLAVEGNGLTLDADAAADAILDGYREALAGSPVPYVLAEAHPALRRMATARLVDPEKFWDKLRESRFVTSPVPAAALVALRAAMPDRRLPTRVMHRIAGLGSLGRPRFVAVMEWRGGLVAREAKPLIASAAAWAAGDAANAKPLYAALLTRAVRCPDPFVFARGRWLVRRLAPDCSRIDLDALPRERDEARLMHAMGRETANIHLGSLSAKRLAADLAKRHAHWLRRASEQMAADVARDWKAWRAR
jgi:uncharacterized protein (DUF2252 family)